MKASMVGEIAVIEPTAENKGKYLQFARQLLQENKHIRTVAVKATATEGRYRVRKVRVIAGKKTTETTYRENGAILKLDLNKVYFSPRLCFERQRIAELVKPGERVLVLFAGVGPYAIVIAKKLGKNAKNTKIVGVELNPYAVEYFKENNKLNKTEALVTVVKADAKKFLAKKENRKAFDRIIMPLPKTAFKFLPGAVRCASAGATIHFYAIASERDGSPFEEAEKQIAHACAKQKRKFKIILKRVALPYAPRVVQVAIDAKIQ